MTIQPTEYVRPTWREVNIELLAERLRQACLNWDGTGNAWAALAEAAVEMIVDEPEREFHASMQAVLNPVTESSAAREWREAKAGDWV